MAFASMGLACPGRPLFAVVAFALLDTCRAPGWKFVEPVLEEVLGEEEVAVVEPVPVVPSPPVAELPPLPSLEEMRRRAAPWPHIVVESALAKGPHAFLLKNLVSPTEVDALIGLAQEGMKTHQEFRSKFHATVSLDKAPELNASKVIQDVNARVAALCGVGEHSVEEGYISVYNEGFTIHSLHMDNHHTLFVPARTVSFVIYLLGGDLKGGGTVFPLLDHGSAKQVGKSMIKISQSEISEWDATLKDGVSHFRLGDDPQLARVCPAWPGSRGRVGADKCGDVITRAKEMCAAGRKGVIAPVSGNAIMFYNHDSAGRETIKAIHAGCGVERGNKVVLAKFVRAGPKPFNDENEFTVALNRRASGRPAAGGSALQDDDDALDDDLDGLDELDSLDDDDLDLDDREEL